MNMRTIIRSAVFLIVLAALWGHVVSAQAADVHVKLDPARQGAGGQSIARFRFTCPPDRYVQKAGMRLSLLDSGGAGQRIRAGDVLFPEAKKKYDDILESTIEYFDGDFSVGLPLQIAPEIPPGDYELAFGADYQTCSPGFCRLSSEKPSAVLTVLLPEATVEAAVAADVSEPTAAADARLQSVATTKERFAQHGMLVAILLSFVTGLGLTLTPCVYPLIPVTITIVGATSGRSRLDGLRRSLVYVLGISITYSTVGVVAAATGGMFGAFLQHPVVYLVLAVIFVLMAGAMFDWYSFDITSQRLQRLQGRLQGKAGVAGILLIGLLSGAAATACIAPIVTAILFYVGQRGSLLLGFVMFFALAWGMGTPLVILGTFTGLAETLPKSGQWMVTVKYIFGLALLGVAVYFVGQSGILPGTAYLVLVGASLLVASVFVGAFDCLTADADLSSRARKAAGLLLIVAAAAAFLAAALDSLPLAASATRGGPSESIEWVESEPEALARAEMERRPLLLDFWTENCAACKKMLRTTFRDPRVIHESSRFVMGKVDLTDSEDPEVQRLIADYDIPGVPFIVVRDAAGRQWTFTEYIGPGRMLSLMQSAR